MKVFGKLTRGQFVRVFRSHPELGGLLTMLARALETDERLVLWQEHNGRLVWASLYEMPFADVVGLWVVLAGEVENLERAA